MKYKLLILCCIVLYLLFIYDLCKIWIRNICGVCMKKSVWLQMIRLPVILWQSPSSQWSLGSPHKSLEKRAQEVKDFSTMVENFLDSTKELGKQSRKTEIAVLWFTVIKPGVYTSFSFFRKNCLFWTMNIIC